MVLVELLFLLGRLLDVDRIVIIVRVKNCGFAQANVIKKYAAVTSKPLLGRELQE